MLPIGTLINVGTVVFGTLLGTSVGNRLPECLRETALVAIGLITLVLRLGLILLDLKRIRMANFLTGLAFAPILALLLHWFGVPVAPLQR